MLTAAYLTSQIVLIYILNYDFNHNGTLEYYLHVSSRAFWSDYSYKARDSIPFYVLMHFNPINLVLKYMILKFDLFTEIAIEV